MLDSLNSTLTRSTIAGFFTRFGKDQRHDELTFDEAVQCLETELGRPQSEKRRIAEDEGEGEGEGVGAPMVISRGGGVGAGGELLGLDFSGPPLHQETENVFVAEPAQQPLVRFAEPGNGNGRHT
jgi:phosphatidylserine decarboxylase